MEHPHTPSVIEPDRPFRIPPAVWLIGAGLIAALVAFFVFKVAIGTVITYSLIGLMLSSHLFMHGGHGSQGGHSQSGNPPANTAGTVDDKQSNAEQTRQSGGCH